MGIIIGGAVGGVVVLGAIVAGVVIYLNKKKASIPTTTITATTQAATHAVEGISMSSSTLPVVAAEAVGEVTVGEAVESKI